VLQSAGASSQPYNQMQDSPPYVPPYPNGMPPGGPPGDRPAGFPPGQHQMPPQGFIPPEASGAMPNYMGGGFRPPGMPPHLRLPPPGPLPGALQNKRPGQIRSWSLAVACHQSGCCGHQHICLFVVLVFYAFSHCLRMLWIYSLSHMNTILFSASLQRTPSVTVINDQIHIHIHARQASTHTCI